MFDTVDDMKAMATHKGHAKSMMVCRLVPDKNIDGVMIPEVRAVSLPQETHLGQFADCMRCTPRTSGCSLPTDAQIYIGRRRS